MEKNSYLHDVPVALIFFNRPGALSHVFESVRKNRPSKLFLIQDGAREGHEDDIKNILACRTIVENIDWKCDVSHNYSDINLGCGERIYTGVTWCFESVDRLIILEDDCLPSDSFYPFCAEIFEYYLHDTRIGLISGMNHLGKFESTTDDYMFGYVGSIAGWATWKRCWQHVDYQMKQLDDPNILRLMHNLELKQRIPLGLIQRGIEKKKLLRQGESLTSWSYQHGLSVFIHSLLIIVPRVNLMSNIGLTDSAVHTVNDIRKVPRAQRGLYRLPLYDMNFPLRHPTHLLEDIEYEDLVRKKYVFKGFKKVLVRMEGIFLQIRYGDLHVILRKIARKLRH